MTKFKYGPLVWNHIEDEDDSGNYWWPGLPPVSYDDTEIKKSLIDIVEFNKERIR